MSHWWEYLVFWWVKGKLFVSEVLMSYWWVYLSVIVQYWWVVGECICQLLFSIADIDIFQIWSSISTCHACVLLIHSWCLTLGETNRRSSALESDALPTDLLGLDHVTDTYTVLISHCSVLLCYCHIDEKKCATTSQQLSNAALVSFRGKKKMCVWQFSTHEYLNKARQ